MLRDIGSPADFPSLPALVEIGQGFFYLTRTRRGRWRLLSCLCPHAGGEVLWEGKEFVCHSHGWRFNEQGKAGEGCLKSFPVTMRNGKLLVRLPG